MNFREFFRASLSPLRPQEPTPKTAARADTHWVSPEITIYRRERSAVWQCRFKLRDGRWHRLSTGCVDLDQARTAATKLAEQWSVREELGLPVRRPCFSVIAHTVIDELNASLAASRGKVVYRDYIAVLERYLIPFFGRMTFEEITAEVIADFDGWRSTRLGKWPRASTLRTHASESLKILVSVIRFRTVTSTLRGFILSRVSRKSSRIGRSR